MKVPHHGGNLGEDSVVKNFFKNVSPKICVISAGRPVRYSGNFQITPKIISDCNSICYNTKNDGAVNLTINNGGFKIRKKAQKN